ncbi:MAG TPA: TetR/AcrR family transcriptional regulator [Acidimicrobiales bacterium]
MTKSAGTRTRTPSAGMEGALLASAADILESEGPNGLSVRRIAAAAGVAPMGVYNHFESKSGIIEALYIQGFARLGAAMQEMAQIADPSEALLEGARRYRALALAHPMAYQVMFLRAVPGFEPTDHALGECTGAYEHLVAGVERSMRAGVIAEAEPTETAQLIWATIHGWVSLELLGLGFVEDRDAAYDHLCEALLRGLRP